MDNMYNQTTKMGVEDLNQKLCDLQNKIIEYTLIMDELWKYHPANPNFINPISLYKNLEIEMSNMGDEINNIESMINALKSTN
jgi:hypothetical protein